MNEILAYIDRDGERFIVVRFGGQDRERDDSDRYALLPDAPYWWRQQGQFIDRSEECS